MQDPFHIDGEMVRPGQRRQLSIEVAKLYDFTEMRIPVEVVVGKKPGPTLFVSAAIHGDEINSIDIVRRLLRHPALKTIHGTLVAIPIVNVFGFNEKSRYLPDRRDLNRSFPGEKNGSMASQIAYIFRTEIVEKCTHGIDLHTGAIHRYNLPQIRIGSLKDEETLGLARAFGAPVILKASTRDGSLRDMVKTHIPVLLYEGGTALRFDDDASRVGVRGILSVMREIGMLPHPKVPERPRDILVSSASQWVRAPHSGIFLAYKRIGEKVRQNELLGVITNPFGDHQFTITAPFDGIIVGCSLLPLANEGEALFHVAAFEDLDIVTDLPEIYGEYGQ